MDNPDSLESVILFKHLEPDERRICADFIEEASYDKGQVIISEGDIADILVIIMSGQVRITKEISTGEKRLATLIEGDFFGEISMFESGVRTATAKAAMPAQVLLVKKEPFERLVNDHPRIGVKILTAMMREMARRFRDQGDMVVQWANWSRATREVGGSETPG